MNEITLQWVQLLKLVSVAIFATLYGFGGINGKWKRRFLGSGFLTSTIIGFGLWMQTFSYWHLLCFFLYVGALSIGYGAEDTKNKIIKRTYCGLAYACASLPIFITSGKWELFALHTIICLLFSVWGGVRNIFGSARAEETSIAVAISYIPLIAI